MRVAVSGAAGRMGRFIAETVAQAEDLELSGLYAPGHGGEQIAGLVASDDPGVCEGSDVVVESTIPGVVVDNVIRWAGMGVHVVIGTSGLAPDEIEALWSSERGCLIVPNFSVGAVMMMRFAELAAPHFQASEIVELHHDGKLDAPSGTAQATAERMKAAGASQRRQTESTESVSGARGGEVTGVPVHSVRLPGLLAHQEVLLGNPGEVLTIRHDSTDRSSFTPGVLAAVRAVPGLRGVHVGLDSVLAL